MNQTPAFRLFTSNDGLKSSTISAVSVSPRGNVWVSHGEADEVSMLDGYRVVRRPAPAGETFRIYESRAGQLWSIYPSGLAMFDTTQGQWIRNPIPEIEAEFQSDPMRRVRQIPLLPVRQNRVLFLLAGRLMEFDASEKRATVLKQVSETGLVKFAEITESREQELWVSGTKGLAHIPGQPTRLTNDSPWEIHLVDESMQAENLTRPFVDASGLLTIAATDTNAAPTAKRVVLTFADGKFVQRVPVPEPIRLAWTDWGGALWALTSESLLRYNPNREPAWTPQREPHGQIRDVAVESNGSFWVATSDGLARFAPSIWQTPDELESIAGWVHALVEDREGRLWVASADGLTAVENGRAQFFAWPERFEGDFTDHLFALPDRRVLVALDGDSLVFDLAARAFRKVIHPEKTRVRFLGPAAGDSIWALVGTPSTNSPARIELFNGEQFGMVPVLSSEPIARELEFALTTRNGDLWFGGKQVLALYQTNTLQRFENFGERERFFCGLEAQDGTVMFGGMNRILEYDQKKWKSLVLGLPGVLRLSQTKDGTVWAATSEGLFVNYRAAGPDHKQEAGLPNPNVWLDHGQEEGLPSPNITDILQDRAGKVWVGTTRGVSLFHPEADTSPPRSTLPRQQHYNTELAPGTVQFSFDGTDKWQQTPSDRLLFSCRIDEGPWTPFINSKFKTFEGLLPGSHRLEVLAMDRTWNLEIASTAPLPFTISIPWYSDSRILSVIAVGLVLVLFFAGLAVNQHLRLIRSHAEIEKIVTIRTQELERAHQDLRQSEKMRAIGTLAAGVAHDFNNILSIIKGSSQIIEDHIQDQEKVRNRVARIKTVVAQGAGIVRSMVGLSRVSDRDLTFCDLNAVVEDTVKLLGDQFHGELSVQFDPDRSLPKVQAAPDLLHQILQNLLLNAADAMERKGAVSVRLARSQNAVGRYALPPAEAVDYVSISVVDTGSGIEQEILPRIFEPFFTTKALSSRHGAGLGLTMVYQLAKEFGYGLQVESRLGHGTTFTLVLPITRTKTASR